MGRRVGRIVARALEHEEPSALELGKRQKNDRPVIKQVDASASE